MLLASYVTFSEGEVDLECCHELWLMATDIAGQLVLKGTYDLTVSHSIALIVVVISSLLDGPLASLFPSALGYVG